MGYIYLDTPKQYIGLLFICSCMQGLSLLSYPKESQKIVWNIFP